METETVTRQEPRAGRPWRLTRRQIGRQTAHLALLTAIIALLALALGAVAAGMQASRDEARAVDLALVVAPAAPPTALADHVFELYRRGYTPRLILAGEGQGGLKAQLVERGVPEVSLLSDGASGAGSAELARLLREARAAGAASLLVVTAPAETLLGLKLARDQGLRAYGAPAPARARDPLTLLEASLAYWRYVLLRR